jgi:hypothetical protein
MINKFDALQIPAMTDMAIRKFGKIVLTKAEIISSNPKINK